MVKPTVVVILISLMLLVLCSASSSVGAYVYNQSPGEDEDEDEDESVSAFPGAGRGETRIARAIAEANARAEAVLPCIGSWGKMIASYPRPSWGKNLWSACSKPCGNGVKIQTWRTTQQPQNGGTACPSTTTRSQGCNTSACPTGGELITVSTVVKNPTSSPATEVGSYTAATTPTVDTTAYEDRAKSTLPSAVQSKINTYGALGTYRRCMGNSYDWNNTSCKKTTGSASDNASPNIYSLYEDEWNTGIMERTIAQHWVANDNGVNCRDLFTYELDQHKQPEGVINKENVEVWRVSAENLYKTDMPGAANLGKDLYCPPLYYKVVT